MIKYILHKNESYVSWYYYDKERFWTTKSGAKQFESMTEIFEFIEDIKQDKSSLLKLIDGCEVKTILTIEAE